MFMASNDEKTAECPICKTENTYSESDAQLNNLSLYGKLTIKCKKCLHNIEIKVETVNITI